MDDGRKNKQTHKGKQKFTNIVKKDTKCKK